MNKIDINKKYRTREGGYSARIICMDAKGHQPIVALVCNASGEERPMMYNKDGRYLHPSPYGAENSSFDLIEVPELEFDWSCLPAWAEWITPSAGDPGCWMWWEKEPVFGDGMYNTYVGKRGLIPYSFSPRYNGSDPAPIFKRPSKEGGEA